MRKETLRQIARIPSGRRLMVNDKVTQGCCGFKCTARVASGFRADTIYFSVFSSRRPLLRPACRYRFTRIRTWANSRFRKLLQSLLSLARKVGFPKDRAFYICVINTTFRIPCRFELANPAHRNFRFNVGSSEARFLGWRRVDHLAIDLNSAGAATPASLRAQFNGRAVRI